MELSASPFSVRVPATSANLGPGFDALGLALTLYGFIALAVGGLGSNLGALIGGLALGLLTSFAAYLAGGEVQQTIAALELPSPRASGMAFAQRRRTAGGGAPTRSAARARAR